MGFLGDIGSFLFGEDKPKPPPAPAAPAPYQSPIPQQMTPAMTAAMNYKAPAPLSLGAAPQVSQGPGAGGMISNIYSQAQGMTRIPGLNMNPSMGQSAMPMGQPGPSGQPGANPMSQSASPASNMVGKQGGTLQSAMMARAGTPQASPWSGAMSQMQSKAGSYVSPFKLSGHAKTPIKAAPAASPAASPQASPQQAPAQAPQQSLQELQQNILAQMIQRYSSGQPLLQQQYRDAVLNRAKGDVDLAADESGRGVSELLNSMNLLGSSAQGSALGEVERQRQRSLQDVTNNLTQQELGQFNNAMGQGQAQQGINNQSSQFGLSSQLNAAQLAQQQEQMGLNAYATNAGLAQGTAKINNQANQFAANQGLQAAQLMSGAGAGAYGANVGAQNSAYANQLAQYNATPVKQGFLGQALPFVAAAYGGPAAGGLTNALMARQVGNQFSGGGIF